MILEDQDFPTFTAKQGEVRSFEVIIARVISQTKNRLLGVIAKYQFGGFIFGGGLAF